MKRIIVEHGMKCKLAKELNTQGYIVTLALYGVRNSNLAMRIRKRALEMGGIEVDYKND